MVGFSESPQTEWLANPSPDRDMRLLADFWFDDRAGRRWHAPAGATIDGASIPRPLWTLVGSPYTGSYRRASIVHDIACMNADNLQEREAADRMFFEACRAGGCSMQESMVLYTGVRVGAGWSAIQGFGALGVALEVKVVRSAADRRLEADFQLAAEAVLAEGPTDDPFEVERRVNAALATISNLPPQP